MKIRRMNEDDVESVYASGIGEGRFSVDESEAVFWSREQLRRWVYGEKDVLLVAEDEGRIAGYVLSQFHEPTGKAIIENLYVNNDYRRQGIGGELIRECSDKLRENGALHICGLAQSDNEVIKRVLKSQGFTEGKDFTWMSK